METLFISLLLAGLVWVIYQIIRPPAAPDNESLKQELHDLRRRLTVLDSDEEPEADDKKGDSC